MKRLLPALLFAAAAALAGCDSDAVCASSTPGCLPPVTTSAEVFAALRDANTELGVTVLVVTHDQAVSEHVQRTIAIRDGRTSSEVLRRSPSDGDDVIAEEYAVMDRAGRVQLTARLYGDIYHASGVQRELRNRLFQSGGESAGFAGLQWMYKGIEPDRLFTSA